MLLLSNINVFDFFNMSSYFLSSSSFIVLSWTTKIFFDLVLNVFDFLIVYLWISKFESIFLLISVWDFLLFLFIFFFLYFSFFFELSAWKEEGTVRSDTLFVPSLNLKYNYKWTYCFLRKGTYTDAHFNLIYHFIII